MKTIEEIAALATDVAAKRDARINAVNAAIDAAGVSSTSLAAAEDAQSAEDESIAVLKAAVSEYAEESVRDLPGSATTSVTSGSPDGMEAPVNAKKKN